MPEKFRGRRLLLLIIVAGIAGIAALANFVWPPQPGPYVEAESAVVEGKGAHIVIQPMDPDNILFSGAVSPDLRTALTVSFNSLKLWDVPSGHLLRTLADRTEGITKLVVFSPDGQNMLTTNGLNDKYVSWDVASGLVLWTLRKDEAVGPFRFSPDGRRLLSGDGLGAVTLRDAVSGQVIRNFKGHSESVTALAFEADGRSALSAAGSEVRRWDIPSGRELNVFKGNFGSVEDIAVLPKGYLALSILSGKTGDTMKAWDVETGRELAAFTSSGSGRLVALSPDGGTVLSAHTSGVERFDVVSGRRAGSFDGDFGAGYQLTFSSNSPILVSSGISVRSGKGRGGRDIKHWAHRVEIWDLAAERRLASFGGQNLGVSSLAFSPGGQVVVSGHLGGAVNLWDMNSGRRLQTFKGDFKEPDSTYVSDWRRGECDTVSGDDNRLPCTTAAVPSPDNRGVLSAGNDRTVNFWTGEKSGAGWRHGGDAGQVQVLALSPDGHIALAGSADGTIGLFDSVTGQNIRNVSLHSSPISALAFLPDGARVLSADQNGMLKLWDVASGREIRSFTSRSDSVVAMAVAPDGATALSGSRYGTVTLWDLRSGWELRTFTGHSRDSIIAVAFSPDGQTALSAGSDGTVKAWDIAAARTFWGRMWWAVRKGAELRTLSGYAGERTAQSSSLWEGRLAFSPDGRTMLTGNVDGSLRLWDHVTGKLLARLLFSPNGSWLTITPEGFYDSSSPEKVKEFAVVRGRDVCSDTVVHDTLYRPDLVSEKIAGDKEGKVRAAAAELNLDKACFGQRQ